MSIMTTQALPTIPAGYTIRRPQIDDADAIAALVNASAIAEIGVEVTTAERVRSDLNDPVRDIGDESWVVIDDVGALVASLDVYEAPPYTMVSFDGYVHPDHTGRGIGGHLLDLAEARARSAIHRAPDGERVTFVTRVWSPSVATHRLLESRGLKRTRDWRIMEIDVTTAPAAPIVPAGITIRTMAQGQDEQQLYETIEAAFSDHWGNSPMTYDEFLYYELDGVPEYDPSLVFVAIDGEQMAGATICRGSRIGDDTVGWVSNLSVRREWRGRGIGRALLLHGFGELHRRGRRAVGLSVDGSSLTGADRLYERVGMREARRDYIYEKELRPASA